MDFIVPVALCTLVSIHTIFKEVSNAFVPSEFNAKDALLILNSGMDGFEQFKNNRVNRNKENFQVLKTKEVSYLKDLKDNNAKQELLLTHMFANSSNTLITANIKELVRLNNKLNSDIELLERLNTINTKLSFEVKTVNHKRKEYFHRDDIIKMDSLTLDILSGFTRNAKGGDDAMVYHSKIRNDMKVLKDLILLMPRSNIFKNLIKLLNLDTSTAHKIKEQKLVSEKILDLTEHLKEMFKGLENRITEETSALLKVASANTSVLKPLVELAQSIDMAHSNYIINYKNALNMISVLDQHLPHKALDARARMKTIKDIRVSVHNNTPLLDEQTDNPVGQFENYFSELKRLSIELNSMYNKYQGLIITSTIVKIDIDIEELIATTPTLEIKLV